MMSMTDMSWQMMNDRQRRYRRQAEWRHSTPPTRAKAPASEPGRH